MKKSIFIFMFVFTMTFLSFVYHTQAVYAGATSVDYAEENLSGIATEAYSARQSSSTTMEINAYISYNSLVSGVMAAAPIDKISAFMQSTSSGHKVNLSISPISNATVFNLSFNEKSLNPGETYRIIAQVEGISGQLWTKGINQNTILGRLYTSGERLYYKMDRTQTSQLTVKHLLQTSLEPVGSTLYVWGGGWNAEDTGSGPDAITMGVSPQWKNFFNQYGTNYKYTNTRYQIRDGLDCSGFIGWTIYNTVNTLNDKDGYVMLADRMASDFSTRGWGTYTDRTQISGYKPGDILSSASHVYMVLGVASDRSLMVIHSTPNGVQINGTPTPFGNVNSKAVQLANKYMSTYYPEWYKKFPNVKTSYSFLMNYDQMTWDVSGNALLSDPEGITNMSAEQVLVMLFDGWVYSNNTWYYYQNGTMVKNGWALDSYGWCFLNAIDGSWVQEGWAKDSYGWGYIQNGYWVQHSMWAEDSNGWVYIGDDGYWDGKPAVATK